VVTTSNIIIPREQTRKYGEDVAMRYFVFSSSKSEQFTMREDSWKSGKWARGILHNPTPGCQQA
jgi:isoleucyl-tRNA synthetase